MRTGLGRRAGHSGWLVGLTPCVRDELKGIGPLKLTQKNKLIAAVALFSLTGAVILIQLFLRGADAADFANTIVCIDAETGTVVPGVTPPEGKMMPWQAKGFKTLYRSEACYYTRDGKVKSTPTYVLVNELLGKNEPTLCPDCGRKVILRNPAPRIELIEEARAAGR